MTQSDNRAVPFRRSWVLAGVAVVLLWRIGALVSPISLLTIPEMLRLPVGLLGLLFMVCGVWAWWIRPDRFTSVFLIVAMGGAIHWGGAPGFADAGLELNILFVYLALSALGEVGLLHLALIYPGGRELPRGALYALYLIAALALLVAPFAGMLSKDSMGLMVGIILGVANLFSLAAGVLFLVSLFRTDSATRRAANLPLIVAALFGSFIVSTLGTEGVLLPPSEAWNLLNGLIPIALAVEVVRFGNLDS